MKVLIATEKPFAPVAVTGIEQVLADGGFETVKLEKYNDKQQLKDALTDDVVALIIRSDKIDSDIIDSAKGLKIIVRAGAGYDNVDLAAATAHGIVVQNTPGQNANAVAELVFGLTLMSARNRYNGTSGTELKDKTIGIHAFGQVGRNVARIAKGFEMQVSALDPFCPDDVMENVGVRPVHTTAELYSENKYVSLHIPANEQTKRSVGYELISLMPHGGVLINTARKEVIDEDGLAKILRDRPDLKYIADIRPDSADDLIKEFGDRVFFTPKKMGAQTAEANINAGLAAARQIVAYLNDGVNKYQVNK